MVRNETDQITDTESIVGYGKCSGFYFKNKGKSQNITQLCPSFCLSKTYCVGDNRENRVKNENIPVIKARYLRDLN